MFDRQSAAINDSKQDQRYKTLASCIQDASFQWMGKLASVSDGINRRGSTNATAGWW